MRSRGRLSKRIPSSGSSTVTSPDFHIPVYSEILGQFERGVGLLFARKRRLES